MYSTAVKCRELNELANLYSKYMLVPHRAITPSPQGIILIHQAAPVPGYTWRIDQQHHSLLRYSLNGNQLLKLL